MAHSNRGVLRRFVRPSISFSGLLVAAGTVLCLLTLAGFGGKYSWLLDAAAHFRVQYFLLLSAAAAALAWMKQRMAAAIFGGFSLVNVILILPLYFNPGEKAKLQTASRGLHIMLLNVNTQNGNYANVRQAIRRNHPDLLLLLEVNRHWLVELAPLTNDYPYSIKQSREDNFGIALYSRLPFKDSKVLHLGEAGVPSLLAELQIGDRIATLLGIHPVPPFTGEHWRLRNQQLAVTADFLNQTDRPVLVVGDLNLTPWSCHFQRFLKETGLRNSTKGFGVQPTWPSFFFPFWIPLDHCLHSEEIRIIDRRVGENVGSDHYPLHMRFVVELP